MDDDIAALRAELARLQARVAELERDRSDDEVPAGARSTRRDAFRLAAGAAAGAVVGAVSGAQPAAAADPNDLVLQTRNTAGGSRTQLDYTGTGHPMGLVVQSGAAFDATMSAHPAALGGWATQAAQPNGVYAYTNQSGGYALVAQSDGGLGAVLVESSGGTTIEFFPRIGAPRGITVRDPTSTLVDGIRAEGQTAILGAGRRWGGQFRGGEVGVDVVGDDFGAVMAGGDAALLLQKLPGIGHDEQPPPDRSNQHFAGEIDIDSSKDVWGCIADGTPGTWRKLFGPRTAGAFHVLDNPVRMFDSRKPGFPNSGRLERNQSRVVSVADGRNTEGVVIAPDAVPEGATAISFNLTVDRTGPSNFLAVVPGSAGGFNSSSINWTSANNALANGLTVGINAAREIKVFCGNGTGGTDFLIDVNGYYR